MHHLNTFRTTSSSFLDEHILSRSQYQDAMLSQYASGSHLGPIIRTDTDPQEASILGGKHSSRWGCALPIARMSGVDSSTRWYGVRVDWGLSKSPNRLTIHAEIDSPIMAWQLVNTLGLIADRELARLLTLIMGHFQKTGVLDRV